MKTSYKYLSFIFLLLFIFQSGNADTAPYSLLENYNQMIHKDMGASFKIVNQNLTISIDKQKMEAYVIPRLEASGTTPMLTKQNSKRAPNFINGTLSLMVTMMILAKIYQYDVNIDQTHVKMYSVMDGSSSLICSFNFNRVAYQKMHFDTTIPQFTRIVSNFKWSRKYLSMMKKESSTIQAITNVQMRF